MESLVAHWKKWSSGLFGLGLLLAWFAAVSPSTAWRAVWLTLMTIVVLAALTLVCYIVLKRRRKSSVENGSAKVLNQFNFGFAPLTGATGKDKAVETANRVKSNVALLKERGINPSEKPWYMVMGYPSSGKTWACWALTRKISTPKRMAKPFSDPSQHAGTANLDFWFYDEAIFIDTAGRIAFQETPEWEELLRNIKIARPDFPINGVILVIGSDELLTASSEDLKLRAERLRDQLDGLKLKLGVRFPVYVLISKADLLPGFREFFSALPEDKRDQIMGWSSESENLDELVIASENVNQDSGDVDLPDTQGERRLKAGVASGGYSRSRFLEALLVPIKRWRLRILSGIGDGDGERVQTSPSVLRSNNVGKRHGFPGALKQHVGKVYDIYLKTIFGDEVDSIYDRHRTRKRLFLRGVYFCSARQGLTPAPIAEESSESSVSRLESEPEPEKRIYFLKTLLESKVFPEQHLVIGDDSIGKRRKRFLLITAAAPCVALLVFLLLAMILQGGLELGVGDEVAVWKQTTNVTRKLATDIRTAIATRDGEVASVLDTHTNLASRVAKDLGVPWVFWPMKFVPDWNVDSERRAAQRKLFENQIVKPILQSCRDRLKESDDQPMSVESLRALGGLLGSLIEIEAGNYGTEKVVISRGRNWLTNALSFLVVGNAETRASIDSLFVSIYDPAKSGSPKWPGDGFSEGFDSLDDSSAIKKGIDWYLRGVHQMNTNTVFALEKADVLLEKLRSLKKAEGEFYASFTPGSSVNPDSRFNSLRAARSEVDILRASPLLSTVLTNGLFNEQSGAYVKLQQQAILGSSGRIRELSDRVPRNSQKSLFSEITNYLNNASLPNGTSGSRLGNRDPSIDDGWLAFDNQGKPHYVARLDILERLAKTTPLFNPGNKFDWFLAWREECVSAWTASPTSISKQQLVQAFQAAFSQWDRSVTKRWEKEYFVKAENSISGGDELKAELEKAGRSPMGISATEMAGIADKITVWTLPLDGLRTDLSAEQTKLGTPTNLKLIDDFTRKAVEDLEGFKRGSKNAVNETYIFALAVAAARKLHFPFGDGLTSVSLNRDVLKQEVAALGKIAELAKGLTNLLTGAVAEGSEQRNNYVAESVARSAGMSQIVDENLLARKCQVSFLNSGSLASSMSRVIIEDRKGNPREANLRYLREGPKKIEIDVSEEIRISGSMVGGKKEVPDVFFPLQTWGILRLIHGSRMVESTTNSITMEYSVPKKDEFRKGELRFTVQLDGIKPWVEILEKSKVQTK